MKVCADCGLAKTEDQFSRQAKSKDGRYPYCKACTSIRHKAAYAARGKRSWTNDKVCSWCGVLKPRTEYAKTPDGHVHSRCVACELDVQKREAAGTRRCSMCKKWKSFEAFHASKLNGRHVTCKECTNSYYWADPNRARERGLKKNYGITLEQYRQLLALQNYACPICLEKFEPDNYSYSVDHAHSGVHRGKIRAITHSECNRSVLRAHEDSRQLRAAADLIDHPLTDWMVPEPMINHYEKRPK
jgi:hypothetical protein